MNQFTVSELKSSQRRLKSNRSPLLVDFRFEPELEFIAQQWVTILKNLPLAAPGPSQEGNRNQNKLGYFSIYQSQSKAKILGSSGISVGMIFATQDFSLGEHGVCRKVSVYLCVLCGKFADASFMCDFFPPLNSEQPNSLVNVEISLDKK